MGIALEWFMLFALCALGNAVFGVFEAETPWWRRSLKWTLVALATWLTYGVAGHWALAVVSFPALLGFTFHFVWCGKHDIHPWNATPRRRYYELRGWEWVE